MIGKADLTDVSGCGDLCCVTRTPAKQADLTPFGGNGGLPIASTTRTQTKPESHNNDTEKNILTNTVYMIKMKGYDGLTIFIMPDRTNIMSINIF